VFGSYGHRVSVEFGVNIIANVAKSQILHYFFVFLYVLAVPVFHFT
jgi:hypothetical protein